MIYQLTGLSCFWSYSNIRTSLFGPTGFVIKVSNWEKEHCLSVTFCHQISLAKFAFNLWELLVNIIRVLFCKICHCSFHFGKMLILITKPVGPNKEVLIFEWDQKQDKPVSWLITKNSKFDPYLVPPFATFSDSSADRFHRWDQACRFDWSSIFFLISNQIDDKKKKKWDATESISSNDNCNDSTQQALIGRKMSQRFFLLHIIDEESIKSDWTKNNFLNPGGSRNSRVGLQLAALVRWFSGPSGCLGT